MGKKFPLVEAFWIAWVQVLGKTLIKSLRLAWSHHDVFLPPHAGTVQKGTLYFG